MCLVDTNFIVFELTRSGLEPANYHTGVEHVNNNFNDINQSDNEDVYI